MAELHSVEGHQTPGGLGFIPPVLNSTEAPKSSVAVSTGASVGSKRLRRPSVRLGDIGGDQYQHVAYDSHVQRPKWRPASNSKESNLSVKSSSRTRILTNLSSGYENTGTLDEDPIAVGTWRDNKWVKSSKRVRSNWAAAKVDEHRERTEQGEDKFSGEEDEELEEGFRDFSREDSESPMKEETQENRNEREVFENRRRYENSNGVREVELSRRGREGVRIWLQELGLGRYWPMFEMHEVDEQVLPLLTLEDLKDMGINAVGSRRKMYCAIQKLGREFS